MPSHDTHYWLAGATVKEMRPKLTTKSIHAIMWADAMTDSCTPNFIEEHNFQAAGAFPTQCYDYDWWRWKRTVPDPRIIIWSTYHFPYQGELGDGRRYRVANDLHRFWQLLEFIEEIQSDCDDPNSKWLPYCIEAGVLLHRIMDGLSAHKWFRGWRDERNHNKNRGKLKQNLVKVFAPPIGHAEYDTDIDEIDNPIWIAPNGDRVDNKALWISALAQIMAGHGGQLSVAALVVNAKSKAARIEYIKNGVLEGGVPDFDDFLYSPLTFMKVARETVLGR